MLRGSEWLRRIADPVVAASPAGRPSMVVGGRRLWRTRNHLDATDMTQQQWRQRWDAARMFLTADGESGKAFGNEIIRIDADGHLRIKTPAALVEQFGTHALHRPGPDRHGRHGGTRGSSGPPTHPP
jgi:hypothetical protein